MCSFAVAGIFSWNNVPHSILPYLRLDNWGTLRSVQYLAVQRLLRIVLCVPICNSGADRKWGGIKTEQPTGTTKIAWRRAFSQFLELVNCGVLTACLSSRNLHFVSRKPWVLFSFYGSNFFFFVHNAVSKHRFHNVVSQRRGPGSIPFQSMWDLWRKKRHCGQGRI